jgi:KEOPS complex subunit Cgi121
MEPEIAVVWGRPEAGLALPSILSALRAFASEHHLEVQLFDAESVVNSDHLRSAVEHAIRSRERKTMRSGSLPMEILLYASGRRQIRDAMGLMGISEKTGRIAAVLVGPEAPAKAPRLLLALRCAPLSETEAAGGAGALDRLGIPVKGAGLGQLNDLALELVALLDIER